MKQITKITLVAIALSLMACSEQSTPVDTETNHAQSALASVKADQNKPSLLFINIDDLNDWNSTLKGHPQTITPNIDRIANNGVTFTRSIAPSPVCFPSRTAVFSGLHPTTTGVISNFNWGRDWREYIPNIVTLPKHLETLGWQTIGAGKNFHKQDEPEFQQYFKRAGEPPIIEGSGHMEGALGWGVIDGSAEDMPDYQLISQAIEALQNSSQPLFLSVGIYRPHVPWNLPQAYFDKFPLATFEAPETIDNDLSDLSPRFQRLAHNIAKFDDGYHQNLVDLGQDKAFARAYLASVHFADEQLGRLLDAWSQSPQSKNGYVILWSDHGYMLGEKEGWGKFKPWWDSTRTNLIVSGPGIEKGVINGSATSLIDLYPTVLDLLGQSQPEHKLDGRSLKPLLDSPSTTWQKPVVMSHEEDGIRYDVVLNDKYRLTRLITGETELYDSEKDPNEWNNIAAEQPEVVAELSRYLTFKAPQINDSLIVEAENLPTQTSAEFGKRGNYHYPLIDANASGGKQVVATLKQKAGSYVDFVVNFTSTGSYEMTVAMGNQLSTINIQASAFKITENAAQATANYPQNIAEENLLEISTESAFQELPAIKLDVKETGLHILRFKSLSDEAASISLDRFKLQKLTRI